MQVSKLQAYEKLDVSKKKHSVTIKNRYTRTPPNKREKECDQPETIQEPSTSIEKRQGSNLKHLSQQVTKMLRKDPLTASKPAQKTKLKTEQKC
jgi:hypothetical protein